MARTPNSWQSLVIARGYATERDMLEDMFERSGLSIRQIGKLINRPYSTVKERLTINGFKMRSRGGPNRKGEL